MILKLIVNAGPLITANWGDRINITVINNLEANGLVLSDPFLNTA
jgi:hypothetical protein